MLFVCPGIYFAICLEICHARIFIFLDHGLLEVLLGPPLGVGLDENARRT